MAGITLEQSLQDLRAMLHEHTPISWNTADLTDFLSQAQQDVAALTLAWQRRVVFRHTDSPQVWMAGVRQYAWDGVVGSGGFGLQDTITVVHLFKDGTSLPKWSPEMVVTADVRSSAGPGEPEYWYQFAGRLGFAPYPSAAFLAGPWDLEVVYAAYPDDWTGGTSVLPSGFDELPTYLAFVKAMLAKRRWTVAQQAYEDVMQLTLQYRQIALARAATPRRALHQPPRLERVDEPSRIVPMRRRR